MYRYGDKVYITPKASYFQDTEMKPSLFFIDWTLLRYQELILIRTLFLLVYYKCSYLFLLNPSVTPRVGKNSTLRKHTKIPPY